MGTARMSADGRITIPVRIRKALGMEPGMELVVQLRENEAAIRPLRSISDLYGIFREYAMGKSSDWETIRSETERAVAEEVAREGLPRGPRRKHRSSPKG
jgi:AbrB family looped-hinge helix DNA binding protein